LQFLPLQPAASSWLEEDKSSIWQGSCQRNHKPTPKHVNNTGPGPGKPPSPPGKESRGIPRPHQATLFSVRNGETFCSYYK